MVNLSEDISGQFFIMLCDCAYLPFRQYPQYPSQNGPFGNESSYDEHFRWSDHICSARSENEEAKANGPDVLGMWTNTLGAKNK